MGNRITSVMRKGRGFTLLELLVVMVLIGLVAGIAVPRFIGSLEKAKVRAGAGKIAASIRAVRMLSLSEKVFYSLVIDVEKGVMYPAKGKYAGEEEKEITGPTVEISNDITIWEKGKRVEVASVEFSPVGTSSGGIFYVTLRSATSHKDENGYVIHVDLLSGRTKLHPIKDFKS